MTPALNRIIHNRNHNRTLPPIAKATGSRNLKVNPKDKSTYSYRCPPENCRSVVKEYGDTTIYPCGRYSTCDPHFQGNNCIECDAIRFILDTWAIANQRRAAERCEAPEPVPPLTHAVIKAVLETMHVMPEQVRELPDTWDPYQRITRYCNLLGSEVVSDRSFVECYNDLSTLEKKRGERPPLQFGDYSPTTHDPMLASVALRRENTYREVMQHIICQAVADGLINQSYINKAVENYGIVPDGHNLHNTLTNICGIRVSEVYELFQVEHDDDDEIEMTLDHYEYSPAHMRHQAMRWNFPRPTFDRLARIRSVFPLGNGNIPSFEEDNDEDNSGGDGLEWHTVTQDKEVPANDQVPTNDPAPATTNSHRRESEVEAQGRRTRPRKDY